jgi:hypothetical protein
MAQALDLPRPVVRGAARLQQDSRGRALREKAGHLAARKSPALADPAGFSRDGYLENALGQIHGDGRMLLHGLLLSVVATVTPYDVGTMMPLTSREESISSLQRTRRPRIRSGRALCSLGSPLSFWSFGGSTCRRVMKWRIAFMALVVLAVFGLASASDHPQPKYSFLVRPSANGVQLEYKGGNAWKTLAADCPAARRFSTDC